MNNALAYIFSKKWIGIILFLYLIPYEVFSQEPFFRHHILGEPYNQAVVHCIHQGAQNKMWLGTDMGLLFFDGIDCQLYEADRPDMKIITALMTDPSGTLWAGSQEGHLGKINESTKRIQSVLPDAMHSAITAISYGEQSNLTIATYKNGLYQFSQDSLPQLILINNSISGDIYNMVSDKGGLWIASDGGLTYLSRGKEGWQKINSDRNISNKIAKTIKKDQKGNIWAGTYGGLLMRLLPGHKDWENFELPNGGIIEDIAIVHQNEVWVATKNKGIWIFNSENKKWHAIQNVTGRAQELNYDSEGNIWIFLDGAGLFSANRFFDFKYFAELTNIQSVLKTDDGLWIGTKRGLYFWDELEDSLSMMHSALKQTNVISLFQDGYGNIWSGTFGQGIYLYSPSRHQVKKLDINDGLTNGNILDIAGSANLVWLATLGGVMEISLKKNPFLENSLSIKNYNQQSGLGTNFIYCVNVDEQGRVWFGTDGNGISVLENGQIRAYSSGKSKDATGMEEYQFQTVYTITNDKDGNIWFSTPENAIFKYDGTHFSKLDRKEGMRELDITGLQTDRHGRILIVHEDGIDHLNPGLNHQMYFGEFVGIKDFQPNLNSSSRDKQGNIWMAASNYLVRCQSLSDIIKIHPSTIITAVSASLKPVDWKQKQMFKYHENQLIISYAGLWYTDPLAVRYRYRLVGYDKDWIASKDTEATYSSLQPGEYSFEVMSTENLDFGDEPITTYSFEIKPAIWKTSWFIALSILIGAAIFYFYLRAKNLRTQNLDRLKKEKAESQLETLRTQINPHFLFNNFNTLISIIEDEPEMAVEYVEHLSDFYRGILKYRERNLISLREELQTLENYAFLLRKRFGNNFSLKINVKNLEVKVIPLSLQSLVENAMKHNAISKQSPLEILIEETGAAIKISNNINPKIKPAVSTGFGLSSLKKQYQLVSNSKVEVTANEKEFIVTLPAI